MKGQSRAELDAKAWELRRSGLSFREIASAMDVSTATAWRSYQRELKRNPDKATVEEARGLELARLDAMLNGLWPAASKGDTVAVDRVLKISQRRARLLGLDTAPAPAGRVDEEHEGTTPGVTQIDDFRRRRDQFRA